MEVYYYIYSPPSSVSCIFSFISPLNHAVSTDDYSITSLFTFTTSPSQDCVDIELLEDSSIEGCHSFSVSLVEPEEPAFSTSGITDILIEDTNDGM